ncbi:MAG: hypothetical protein SFV51_21975 [Bryobacteraceae bacterium]|nr:hypothetical protein [Bryobacteraceae bacterium]
MTTGMGIAALAVIVAMAVVVQIRVAAPGRVLPLELVMHHAAAEGRMPVQMSYSGWNFDIVTGITAIPVASTPVFAAFGPDRLNTWIADAPFVWLPCVLVPAALLGHLLLWRKLGE